MYVLGFEAVAVVHSQSVQHEFALVDYQPADASRLDSSGLLGESSGEKAQKVTATLGLPVVLAGSVFVKWQAGSRTVGSGQIHCAMAEVWVANEAPSLVRSCLGLYLRDSRCWCRTHDAMALDHRQSGCGPRSDWPADGQLRQTDWSKSDDHREELVGLHNILEG